jgi:hypothetical protein
MNAKSFIIGTITGAIAFFLVGYLLYGIVLVDFFQANAGSATGVMKETPDMILLFLGEIAWGALFTYIFLQWANIRTLASGAKAGAILGFLMGLGFNLISVGTANLINLTGAIGDSVVQLVMGAVAGGLIGLALGKVSD